MKTASMNEIELENIPLALIEFGERAREKYKELASLTDSIKLKGIIQPIAVMRTPKESKPFLLLAGGRRLSAATLAELKEIPARIYSSELNLLEQKEIELMENVDREDMDHIEEARLTDQIHKLQQKKHGIAFGSSTSGHSASDTAKLMGKSPMTISRKLELARALEENPELLEATKTESEALRVIRNIEKKKEDAVVAERFDTELKVDDGERLKRKLANGYIVGDFFERIKNVPDRSQHLIEIDPPYGIDLKNIKNSFSDVLEDYNEVESEDYVSFLMNVISEAHRVLLPSGWIICWHATQHFQMLRETLEAFDDISTTNVPAIWTKGIQGQSLRPETHLASTYEPFIYAKKGTPILRKPGRPNVFSFPPIATAKKLHSTERPIELLEEIFRTFVPTGSNICVPFLGSGNSLLAASNVSSNSFGYEISEEFRNGFVAKVESGTLGRFTSY
jgi:ParB/RepB/Spo0J family partition protein